MEDIVRLDPKEPRYIMLPVNYHEMPERQARIHWIQDIGEGFFLAGCEFTSSNEMCTWVMELTSIGFVPMFNISHINIEDLIEKAKRLKKSQEVKGE